MTLSDGPPPGARKTEDDAKENLSLRVVLPQIAACVAANSFYLPDGAVVGYSAILIPQLELPKSEIAVTRLQTAWLTSLMMLVVPVGELLAVLLMERWGRVRALQLSLVPFVIGCIVIGVANSFNLILVGKVLIGISLAVGTSPASIYVTEVARPDLRGALITAGPLIGAAGLLIAYAAGAVLEWRGVSYSCCFVALVPLLMLAFWCPESPVWLVRKGRHLQAEQALRRLAPLDRDKDEYAALEVQALIVSAKRRDTLVLTAPAAAPAAPAAPAPGWVSRCVRSLRKGTAALWKRKGAKRPLILLCVLMFLQQFSGAYVTLFYAVTFFNDVQNSVDDYTAAALVGLLRLIMAVVTLPLLSRFGRRQLLLWSAALMCASMLTSGFFSRRFSPAAAAAAALGGGSAASSGGVARWVSPLCVLLYVCSSCIGVLSVPWILAAELFPQEVRGAAQAIILSLAHFFMFVALQTYRELNAWLGSDGVQWLYASVCAFTVLFVWLVVPETQGRTSEQIESFFENYVLYIGRARLREPAGPAGPPSKLAPEDIPDQVFYLEGREEPEGAAAGGGAGGGAAGDAGEESCVTRL